MSKLTHRTAPSCTYFVTTNTWQKRTLFDVRENAEIVLAMMLEYRESGAYSVHEFVIMPDHLHVMITPSLEYTLEKSMQLIKGGSSRAIHLKRGHKMQIWQSGFYEWTVRNAEDYSSKQRYIWQNPVSRGLVANAEQWILSSAAQKYHLDPMPEKLSRASGAEAPHKDRPFMSELKLRPPKRQIIGVTSPEVIGEIEFDPESSGN